MELKRVVVTGLGAVSPLGNDVETTWKNAIAGISGGAGPITHFDASKFKTQFACEVKDYDPSKYMDRKELRKCDRYTQLAIGSSEEAIADSGLDFEKENCDRIGGYHVCRYWWYQNFRRGSRILLYTRRDGT